MSRHVTWRCIKVACVLALVVCILAPFPCWQPVTSALAFIASNLTRSPLAKMHPAPQGDSAQSSKRRYATRIRILVHNTHELTFDEAIIVVTLLDPNVAAAETQAAHRLVITGLNAGETLLIVAGKHNHTAYIIQVARPPRATKLDGSGAALNQEAAAYSGFYALHFSPGTDGAPSLLRQDFEFNQKLPGSRTLRAGGEVFNFFGRGERGLVQVPGTNFGMNRTRLGVDSPASKFDLLDSELEISRLGFNNYTLRGPHFVSTSASRWRGLEIFAGRARPQRSFFNEGEGLLAGALAPLAQGNSWRIRAGAFFVSPQRLSMGREGGTVWSADARYSPDENSLVEAEMAYSNGSLSWRTRLELRRGPLHFYGELFRLDRRSPFVSIGAQTAGRRMNTLSLQWRPDPRFGASFTYHSTTNFPLSSSRQVQLDGRTINATASYAPVRASRVSFSFNRQEIETAAALALPFLLNLQTRTSTFRYGQRIGHNWTSDFEARLIQGREAETTEQTTRGLSLREQLRYSWRRGSVAGFVNFKSNTPSLTGLVLRNPLLLPAELRLALAADPARFLLANRDALPRLLSGVELPTTRSTEAGARLQAAFSRLNLTSEVRYSVGEILARQERTILSTLSADFKLDAANSIQMSGARLISFSGPENRNALTISYVHRFGEGSGRGFQLSRLLRPAHASLQGRVFFDLNNNGREDLDEPGVAGMKVQLDGSQIRTTDLRGHYSFKGLEPGDHHVALVSEELGLRLRASNMTLRHVTLSAREAHDVSFGVTNFGFAAGRVFNDLFISGEMAAGDAPGCDGVRMLLRPVRAGSVNTETPLSMVVNASGAYEFRNLVPGSYILEIDPASIPTDFRLPGQTSWPITISPLQGSYTDLPLIAERAVSGIVFIDRDANGQFDAGRDEAIKGARVSAAGRSEGWTDEHGSYILRNLPAGRIGVRAELPTGRKNETTYIELGPNPVFRKNLNLLVRE